MLDTNFSKRKKKKKTLQLWQKCETGKLYLSKNHCPNTMLVFTHFNAFRLQKFNYTNTNLDL